jgi:hypothetical protein
LDSRLIRRIIWASICAFSLSCGCALGYDYISNNKLFTNNTFLKKIPFFSDDNISSPSKFHRGINSNKIGKGDVFGNNGICISTSDNFVIVTKGNKFFDREYN